MSKEKGKNTKVSMDKLKEIKDKKQNGKRIVTKDSHLNFNYEIK